MPSITLWGAGVKGRSSNVSAQRRVNLYADSFQGMDADKGQFVLYSRPGLSPRQFTNPGTGFGGGPLRGAIAATLVANVGTPSQFTMDLVFAGQGGYGLVSVNNNNRFLSSGPGPNTYRTTDGPLVFADNGSQVVSVDGVSAYIAQYSIGAYSQSDMQTLGIANFPYGARTICAIASRFVVDNPNAPGRFNWSAVLDGLTWAAVDYATAESDPDALVGVYAWRGELLLLGTRTIEFWAPTGDSSVFARVSGSVAPWGCLSYQTVQQVDSSLFMLARNVAGGLIKALVIRKQGHTFYVLNLPSKTWAYNATTGEWDEWQTDGGRFAGEYAFYAYGRASVTDYRDSRIYGLSDTAYQDDTGAMLRQVDTRHIAQDLERITVNRVTLDVEQGVGLNSGQGSDPQIALQVSRDGGHTFGNELWTTLGKQGGYSTRVEWWRLGRARDFVFRFKIFDAVKAVFIGASMDASK